MNSNGDGLRIPAGIKAARFDILDREFLKNLKIMAMEDEVVFRAIAMAGCPAGCIFVEDEREELE